MPIFPSSTWLMILVQFLVVLFIFLALGLGLLVMGILWGQARWRSRSVPHPEQVPPSSRRTLG